MRILDFSDGFTSSNEPTQGNLTANKLKNFASDAAFVSDKGSAASEGDVYCNTTDNVIKFHNGSSWLVIASTNDLDASNVAVTPSGNLSSTDAQSALEELQSDIDTRALDSDLSNHASDTTSVHGITDTANLVTKTGVEQLTNKDIDGGTASNTSRITVPKNTITNLTALTRKQGNIFFDTTSNKPYYDDGTNLKVIGSGSSGETNLISDGDADASNIFTSYADSGSRPIDGTGGTPNVTSSISSTSPLTGNNSFLLTKDAANRQGQGWSVPFSVDTSYRAKVLQIEFDYIVNSGTFTAGNPSSDSDVIVYIYDVTNSQLIEPSSFKLLSSSTSISDKFIANFQTSATGSNYRLIYHVASTSASAYSLKIDNVKVKPCNYIYGTVISDWKAYTPTFGAGFGTPLNQSFFSRRVGDSLEIYGKWTNGTVAANTTSITVGYNGSNANVTIDTSKVPTNGIIGTAQSSLAATTYFGTYPVAPSSNGTAFFFTVQNSTTGFGSGTQTANVFSASTSLNSVHVIVPIVGWSANSQVSDGYDGRLVVSRAYRNSTAQTISTTTATKVQFNASTYDRTSSLDTTTNFRFTAPSYGLYNVRASVLLANFTASEVFKLQIYKNGVQVTEKDNQSSSTTPIATVFDTLELNANDYVEIFAKSTADTSYDISADSKSSFFIVEKITAPTTISARERIVASYADSSGQSITSSNQIVSFNTLVEDTHAIKSGNNFIIVGQGTYRIFCQLQTGATTTAGNQYFIPKIYVDGVAVAEGGNRFPTSHISPTGIVEWVGPLNANQVITIRIDTDVAASRSLSATALANRMSIIRIA